LNLHPVSQTNAVRLLDGHIGDPQLRAACLAVNGLAFINCPAANSTLPQKLAAAPFTDSLFEICRAVCAFRTYQASGHEKKLHQFGLVS
jgi:hypothetical protein